jgi:hypothetical protein
VANLQSIKELIPQCPKTIMMILVVGGVVLWLLWNSIALLYNDDKDLTGSIHYSGGK